jgi:hypothetical protein
MRTEMEPYLWEAGDQHGAVFFSNFITVSNAACDSGRIGCIKSQFIHWILT